VYFYIFCVISVTTKNSHPENMALAALWLCCDDRKIINEAIAEQMAGLLHLT
jgi:hypothetical protein